MGEMKLPELEKAIPAFLSDAYHKAFRAERHAGAVVGSERASIAEQHHAQQLAADAFKVFVTAILAAISAAAQAEREACAKIAADRAAFFDGPESLHPLHQREMETAEDLAARIRARARPSDESRT